MLRKPDLILRHLIAINWDGFHVLNFNFRPHACKKILRPFPCLESSSSGLFYRENSERRRSGEAQMGAVMSVEEKWLHGAEMHGKSGEELLELCGFVSLGIENWFFHSLKFQFHTSCMQDSPKTFSCRGKNQGKKQPRSSLSREWERERRSANGRFDVLEREMTAWCGNAHMEQRKVSRTWFQLLDYFVVS